jgi:hypothetical protein
MPLTGLLGRNGVSPVLRQNIDDLPFLINGTPQVLELTVDCQVHLIQVPGTSDWPAAPTQSFGICASNLVHYRRTVSKLTVRSRSAIMSSTPR